MRIDFCINNIKLYQEKIGPKLRQSAKNPSKRRLSQFHTICEFHSAMLNLTYIELNLVPNDNSWRQFEILLNYIDFIMVRLILQTIPAHPERHIYSPLI